MEPITTVAILRHMADKLGTHYVEKIFHKADRRILDSVGQEAKKPDERSFP
jgi:hypothetical protein